MGQSAKVNGQSHTAAAALKYNHIKVLTEFD